MKVLIYGKGDFAKLVLHYLNTHTNHEVVGFCADSAFIDSTTYLGYPLFDIDQLDSKILKNTAFFVAVGYSSMVARETMFNKLFDRGYRLINIYCRGCQVDSTVKVGVNNIFMPNVLIEPFCTIGNNNILWSKALICHDTSIGNHNFFASNTTVGGFCEINNSNFFGFNSTVVDNIKIKNFITLGAMSLLLTDISEQGKYLGVPAKKKDKS